MDPVVIPDPNVSPGSGPDNTGTNEEAFKFDDKELEGLGDTTRQKINTLLNNLSSTASQKKHWREKAQKLMEDIDSTKAGQPSSVVPKAPVQITPAPAVNTTIPDVDLDKKAFGAAMAVKKEEFLLDLPEDKRPIVEDFYKGLTTGKEINVSNFSTYMMAACRAAGVEVRKNTYNSISSSSNGALPPTPKAGPTTEEKQLAERFGNKPEAVYSEKLDTKGLLNAEKFFGKKD